MFNLCPECLNHLHVSGKCSCGYIQEKKDVLKNEVKSQILCGKSDCSLLGKTIISDDNKLAYCEEHYFCKEEGCKNVANWNTFDGHCIVCYVKNRSKVMS